MRQDQIFIMILGGASQALILVLAVGSKPTIANLEYYARAPATATDLLGAVAWDSGRVLSLFKLGMGADAVKPAVFGAGSEVNVTFAVYAITCHVIDHVVVW